MRMIRKLSAAWLCLAVLMGALAPNAIGADAEKKLVLKVADIFPVSHILSVEGISVWMKKVQQLTNGNVEFSYYPAEQLGKTKDLLKLVQARVADIAFIAPTYDTSSMPLSNVMILPNAFKDSIAAADIYWNLTQGMLKPEFAKLKVQPILLYGNPPYEVWTTGTPVRMPGDMKGMKLRSAGGIMDQTVDMLKATPLTVPAGEIYESLQRKVVDGTVLSLTSVKPYKLQELLKYTTEGAEMGSFIGLWVINDAVWKSLSEANKKAFTQATIETNRHLAEALVKEYKSLIQEFQSLGITVNKLNDQEKTEWKKLMQPIEKVWIDKIGSTAGSVKLAEQVLEERKKLQKKFE